MALPVVAIPVALEVAGKVAVAAIGTAGACVLGMKCSDNETKVEICKVGGKAIVALAATCVLHKLGKRILRKETKDINGEVKFNRNEASAKFNTFSKE